jgi:Protein of unknown function (DUF1499)
MNDDNTDNNNASVIPDDTGIPLSETETPNVEIVTKPAAAKDWQSFIILACGIGAVLWGIAAPVGAGWGLWDWKLGLGGLKWSFFLGLGTLLLGGLYIWRGKRKGAPNRTQRRPLLWLGTLIGAGYTLWIVSLLLKAFSVPAIHDISTDLADPPKFAVLKERADNFDDIPGADDSDMRGLNPQQRWVTLHQKAYGDVRSVRISQPTDQVMAKAARLAKERGWTIMANAPLEGHLEATATTALFRFKDDIVLRVRPTQDGAGSIVDMRSVSRVGQSDIGVNAKRVRAFLADLSGTVTAAG